MKRRHPQIIDVEETGAMGFKDPRSYVRRGKTYRFGQDILDLRTLAFQRSKGYCEMITRGYLHGRCQRNISWETFEMHHEPPLSQGGDDSLEGVLASCKRCHVSRHGRVPRWTKRERREAILGEGR